jgi:hypothetical protein
VEGEATAYGFTITRFPEQTERILWLDRPVERLTVSNAADKALIESGNHGEIRDLVQGVFMHDIISVRPGMFSFAFIGMASKAQGTTYAVSLTH